MRFFKCAIHGKSSKHAGFIFVSYLSQNINLSLEGGGRGGGGQATTYFVGSHSVYHSDNTALSALRPLTCRTNRSFLLGSCWRFISRLISTCGFSTCSNQRVWQTALKKWQIQKICCFVDNTLVVVLIRQIVNRHMSTNVCCLSPFCGPDRIPHTWFRPKRHLILDYVGFIGSLGWEAFLGRGLDCRTYQSNVDVSNVTMMTISVAVGNRNLSHY